MSSLGRISKVLLREKVKYINLIFIIDIFGGLYSIILNTFFSKSRTTSYMGMVFASIFLGIILLTWLNERTYSNDKFRLIPLTDGIMYLGNILTTFIAFIYLLVGETVLYFVSYSLFPNRYDAYMINGFNSTQQYFFTAEVIVSFILGIIFIWTVVTSVHMIINWISNFLPFRNQNLIKIIIMLVVIVLLGIPFTYITTEVSLTMGINGMGSSFKDVSHVIYSGMAILIIWIAIFTVVNLYFLNRWSETEN